MLDTHAAPIFERFLGRRDGLLRVLDMGFRHRADHLRWRAGIDRVDQVIGPDLLAVNHERIFLTKPGAHFADRAPHSLAAFLVDEIYQRRILVGVARRRLERLPIASRCSRDR